MTPHLHQSSWVICFATAVVCALIVAPGEITEPYAAPYPTFSHGWPLVFLKRHVDNVPEFRGEDGTVYKMSATWVTEPPPSAAPWTSWVSWRFWHAAEYQWSAMHLLLDGLVVVSIVASVTALWERRRRGTSNAFQFRIAELLAMMCFVAIALGLLQYTNRASTREQQLYKQFAEAGLYLERKCCAPAWLRRLVGQGYVSNSFFHCVEIDLSPGDVANHPQLAQFLVELHYLHTVRIDVQDGELGKIFDALSQVTSLRTIDFSTYNWRVSLNDAEIASLARLTQLRELRLDWDRQFDQELKASIRNLLPHCRITSDVD